MSVAAVTWAYKVPENLDAYEAFLLVTIADQADDYGVAWAKSSTLQAKCRCSERKVSLALKRLHELGLLARIHRRHPNGSQRSSLFVLIGWDGRSALSSVEDHPALKELHVEGCDALDTISPHIVRSVAPVQKPVDKPAKKPRTARTTEGTPPHDRGDPPAHRAPLEPSIEPKKEPIPLTPDRHSTLSTPTDCIKSGKVFLCTQISLQTARRCIAAGLVTVEQCRAVGISV